MDITPSDNQMIHRPSWKQKHPSRWVTQGQDLKLTFKKNGVAWAETSSEGTNGLYTECLQHIVRSREKSQEQGRPSFIGTVKRDVWHTILDKSQSGRTGQAYHILTSKQNNNHQSTHINYHKHLHSFIHSNNKHSLDLKYLQPVHNKIYNKSINA